MLFILEHLSRYLFCLFRTYWIIPCFKKLFVFIFFSLRKEGGRLPKRLYKNKVSRSKDLFVFNCNDSWMSNLHKRLTYDYVCTCFVLLEFRTIKSIFKTLHYCYIPPPLFFGHILKSSSFLEPIEYRMTIWLSKCTQFDCQNIYLYFSNTTDILVCYTFKITNILLKRVFKNEFE